jgi:hypothetical protein
MIPIFWTTPVNPGANSKFEQDTLHDSSREKVLNPVIVDFINFTIISNAISPGMVPSEGGLQNFKGFDAINMKQSMIPHVSRTPSKASFVKANLPFSISEGFKECMPAESLLADLRGDPSSFCSARDDHSPIGTISDEAITSTDRAKANS